MRLLMIAAAATAALTGCQTTTTGGDATAQDAALRASLAPAFGRRYGVPGSTFQFNENGTIEGDLGGAPLAGVWTVRDGFYCRTLTEGPPQAMAVPTDCQTVELDGDQLIITRDRGRGERVVYQAV